MGFGRRSRWWVLVAVSAVLGGGLVLPEPAVAGADLLQARAEARGGDRPAAILLGDSYASGEGGRWEGNGPGAVDRGVFQTYGGTWDYPAILPGNAGGCHRSDVAVIYPYETFEALDLARNKVNVACGGAEIKHVLTDSFKGEKPQIEQLKERLTQNPGIKYVVLSVGGNDAGVSGVAQECVKKFVLKQSAGLKQVSAAEGEKYQAYVQGLKESDKNLVCAASPELSGLEGKLEHVYETLFKEAISPLAPDAQLVVLNYPNPLPAADSELRGPLESNLVSRLQDGGCPFFDKDFAKFAGIAKDINGTIQNAVTAAAKNNVPIHLLDVSGMYQGHEVCASGTTQDKEWIRQVPADLLSDPGLIHEALHPNAFGQRMEGKCVSNFLDELSSRATKSANEHGVCQDNANVQVKAPGNTTR
ncbi:SGNH/GDSL hydrolase family protein [Nocardia colli]|uniref:SGNH/GDSL hydrolase family protein n=1 Tax=Nocardia colli TaxID=2545717 RepID=UPI00168D5BEA|nr:SGNH/GDSL hydrolase family protein [Nocardia colli]